VRVSVAHEYGLELMGELPDGVAVVVAPDPDAETVIWVPTFLGTAPAAEAFDRLGALRVVQLLTAGVDTWVGRVPSQVTLCDARGVHTSATAEWAVTAILAYVRDFPHFARAQARGEWAYRRTGELAGKRVLIVGAGSIGEGIADRLRPFEVSLTLVARRARDGVHGVDELPELLPRADIVVLTVPLTDATVGLVDADFLAAMPDGALLVNAARGRVVDTAALTLELAKGRLGAALDVTDPEPLPPGDPLWQLPNVLLTPHVAGSLGGELHRLADAAADELARYAAGEPFAHPVLRAEFHRIA
jgi:phosphoglycerate dehydrogenase-like enzyme